MICSNCNGPIDFAHVNITCASCGAPTRLLESADFAAAGAYDAIMVLVESRRRTRSAHEQYDMLRARGFDVVRRSCG